MGVSDYRLFRGVLIKSAMRRLCAEIRLEPALAHPCAGYARQPVERHVRQLCAEPPADYAQTPPAWEKQEIDYARLCAEYALAMRQWGALACQRRPASLI